MSLSLRLTMTCLENSYAHCFSAELASAVSQRTPLHWTCLFIPKAPFHPHHTFWAVLQQLFVNSDTFYIFQVYGNFAIENTASKLDVFQYLTAEFPRREDNQPYYCTS